MGPLLRRRREAGVDRWVSHDRMWSSAAPTVFETRSGLLNSKWRGTCSLAFGTAKVGGRGREGKHMNWDQIEGKWKQFTGAARERWGKLTDDDWQTIAGKKDQLIGRIQERYGIARTEAEKQADEWSRVQQSKVDEDRAVRL